MSDLPTLDELFAKAGIGRDNLMHDNSMERARKAALELKDRRGKPKAFRFAMIFIKNNFDAKAAYAEFVAGLNRPKGRAKWWPYKYAENDTVRGYVAQILREALEGLKQRTGNHVQSIIDFCDAIIWADGTELLEQRMEYQLDADGNHIPGSGRLMTYLKPIDSLTSAQRRTVKRIRLREGCVADLETESRMEAMKIQLLALEVIHRRGGSDKDWIGDFKQRISAAREKRIEMEIRAGKVIRLPTQEKASGGG